MSIPLAKRKGRVALVFEPRLWRVYGGYPLGNFHTIAILENCHYFHICLKEKHIQKYFGVGGKCVLSESCIAFLVQKGEITQAPT